MDGAPVVLSVVAPIMRCITAGVEVAGDVPAELPLKYYAEHGYCGVTLGFARNAWQEYSGKQAYYVELPSFL